MSEVYKDLPGWEGIYQVSDHGNVKSMSREINGRLIQGRVLKPGAARETLKVNLCTGTRSVSQTYTVGHLVLLAFVGEKPSGCKAKHRDGDQKNNRASNLYWGVA